LFEGKETAMSESQANAQGQLLELGDRLGFVLPAGTTAQRPLQPVVGQVRYNTDLKCLEFYNGSSWQELAKGEAAAGQVYADDRGAVRLHLYTDASLAGQGSSVAPLRVEPQQLAGKVPVAVQGTLSGDGTAASPLRVNVRGVAQELSQHLQLLELGQVLDTLNRTALRADRVVAGQGIRISTDAQGRLVIAVAQGGGA
jgi:hypothetical protein